MQANHASVLNVQGRYRQTVGLYGHRSRASTHLQYEVARAVYQIDPGNRRAVEAFADLSSLGSNQPWPSLNALARMVAHMVRQAKDLDECKSWNQRGLLAAERSLQSDGGFGAILGASRVHRAVALCAATNRDLGTTADHLQVAESLNAELATSGHTEFDRIMQLQDERLIYEAGSKAYVATGQCMTRRPQDEVVRRLVELDPCDPYIRLICGDALWAMESNEDAIEHFEEATNLGTLVGACAAFRLASIWRWADDPGRSLEWLEVTAMLDPGFAGGPDDWRHS